MSDTPRTDEESTNGYLLYDEYVVPVGLAATLEKECNALKAELAKVKAENEWHPASCKPSYARRVLIDTAWFGVNVGSFVEGNWYISGLGIYGDDQVLSWRELPNPPEVSV